jgi:hypothetical protein
MTVFLLVAINITLTLINVSLNYRLERIAEVLERIGDKS